MTSSPKFVGKCKEKTNAITICGQGLVKEVVANAINKQFSDYVSEKDTNMTLKNMTQEEKATEYELFLNETFSGLGKYFFFLRF